MLAKHKCTNEECLEIVSIPFLPSALSEIVAHINMTKKRNSKTCMHCEVANLSPTLPLEILITGFNSHTDKYIAMCLEDVTEMEHRKDFTFMKYGDDSVLIQLLKNPPRKGNDKYCACCR